MDTQDMLGGWLERELVDAPPDLAVRVRAALPSEWQSVPLGDGPSLLAEAAANELRDLLRRGCETRRSAPGLLTADALITAACGLLAATGADMDSGTLDILNTVARVAPNGDSPA
jgi:hypothetical protein